MAVLKARSADVGLPPVSDQTVRALVAEVERTGFAVLPGYINAAALRTLQRFVVGMVREAGGETTGLAGEAIAGTVVAELADHPSLQGLARRIYEDATGRAAPDQAMHTVLRCLSGKTSLKHCFKFHYDSYVVTLLLPIVIPTQGRRGNLVIAPNLRTLRSGYLHNLVDKVIVENPVTGFALSRLYRSGLLELQQVDLTPGDLYVFWGYRTLHTNESFEVDNIRGTALFHFGNPHADSPLRGRLGAVRRAAAQGLRSALGRDRVRTPKLRSGERTSRTD